MLSLKKHEANTINYVFFGSFETKNQFLIIFFVDDFCIK